MSEGKAALICIILYIVLAIGGLWGGVNYYNDHTYKADQAKEWLWRARATNDLTDMAGYLEESSRLLGTYYGNPCWWFPKPDTDYDLIKTNIQEVTTNAREWGTSLQQDNVAYQQAVQNLQETIQEIAEHLDGTNWWNGNPLWGLLIFNFWTWVWLPLILMWAILAEM